ncbi:MAG: FAD:protein FMN transferase [Bacteroidales bacterium]|nr:FAD:protein FMN transferase [Bacteroidales bacterium]
MADALATACMVIGTEKSKDLINSLEGVEAYLISSDGTWTSEGFHIDK